jgi:hypothetical protein
MGSIAAVRVRSTRTPPVREVTVRLRNQVEPVPVEDRADPGCIVRVHLVDAEPKLHGAAVFSRERCEERVLGAARTAALHQYQPVVRSPAIPAVR